MAVRADDVDLTRDRSLVELCQAGDEAAFGDLYNRYYQRLLRFCLRRVGNVHEAEEITQEAFARAFTAMPRFAGERRFYPWLTVIAGRLCIDSHRRVSRSEPSAEVDPGTVDGGQQAIIDNVDFRYLAQAMKQLGPRHREVLELRESHGWSYQQIADHYNVTMGTVEALLFRARKALRREFLALAGPEARLATLPVLGVAWRLATRMRTRMSDLSSQLAPAAAASAMSVAAVATSLGGGAAAAPAASAPVDRPLAKVLATTVQAVNEPVILDKVNAPLTSEGTVAAPVVPKPLGQYNGVEDGTDAQEARPSGVNIGGTFIATDVTDFGRVRVNSGLAGK